MARHQKLSERREREREWEISGSFKSRRVIARDRWRVIKRKAKHDYLRVSGALLWLPLLVTDFYWGGKLANKIFKITVSTQPASSAIFFAPLQLIVYNRKTLSSPLIYSPTHTQKRSFIGVSKHQTTVMLSPTSHQIGNQKILTRSTWLHIQSVSNGTRN